MIEIQDNKLICPYSFKEDKKWDKIQDIIHGLDKVLKTKNGITSILDVFTYQTDVILKDIKKKNRTFKLVMKVYNDVIKFIVEDIDYLKDKDYYLTILYAIKSMLVGDKNV